MLRGSTRPFECVSLSLSLSTKVIHTEKMSDENALICLAATQVAINNNFIVGELCKERKRKRRRRRRRISKEKIGTCESSVLYRLMSPDNDGQYNDSVYRFLFRIPLKDFEKLYEMFAARIFNFDFVGYPTEKRVVDKVFGFKIG